MSCQMSINTIVIQPTSFCNINCSYCYLANRNDKKLMSFSLLEQIMEKIFKSKIINNDIEFLWHAGEPLVAGISFYQTVFEMAKKYSSVYEKKFHNAIQTNATLISQKWCDFFISSQFRIGVSIDGPQFIHDMYRKNRQGKGTFDSTMNGIKLLHKNNITFGALFVVTKESLNYPEEIFNFFLEHNIKWVGFNIESILSYNTTTTLAIKENQYIFEQYKRFLAKIFDLWIDNVDQIDIREFTEIANMIKYKLNDKNFRYSTTEANELEIITISKEGNITTNCPELADDYTNNGLIIGNINDISSLDDIINNEKRKMIYSEIKLGINKCKDNCSYFDFCGGGSPATKLYENKTFNSMETTNCILRRKAILDVALSKFSLSS